MKFQLNGGFFWQPENEIDPGFLGENINSDQMNEVLIKELDNKHVYYNKMNNKIKVKKYDPRFTIKNDSEPIEVKEFDNQNDLRYYLRLTPREYNKVLRKNIEKYLNNKTNLMTENNKKKITEEISTADMAVSDKSISKIKNKIDNFDPYKDAQNIQKGSKTIIGKDDNFLQNKEIENILESLQQQSSSDYPLGKSFNAKQNEEHEITNPYKGNIFGNEKQALSSEYEENKEVKNILESLYESTKKFNTKERRQLSKKGEAEPDGSFPIRNKKDLKNAIHDFGRAGAKSYDKKWIKKRAKELGAEDLLPEKWKNESIIKDLNHLVSLCENKKTKTSFKTKNNLRRLIEAVSEKNVQTLIDKLNEIDNKDFVSPQEKKIENYIVDELIDMGYFYEDGEVNKDLMYIDKNGNYTLKTKLDKIGEVDKLIHNNDDSDENLDDITGKRVELISMEDDYTKLKPGDKGIIVGRDDIGDIMVDWDNGSTLKLIPGVDKYRILENDDYQELDEGKNESHENKKFGKVMDEFGKGKLHSGSKYGPKVTNRKQAIAIAYSESEKDKKKNESIKKISLPFLKEGKLKEIRINKDKFTNFIKENCEVDNYLDENNNLDIDKFLNSRPISFKQSLIKSFFKK